MPHATTGFAAKWASCALALGLLLATAVGCSKPESPPPQSAASPPPTAPAPSPAPPSAGAPGSETPTPDKSAPPAEAAAEEKRGAGEAGGSAAPAEASVTGGPRHHARPPAAERPVAVEPDRRPAPELAPPTVGSAGPAAAAPQPPPPPPATAAPSVIDSVGSQLAQKPVSYNKPSELTFGRPTTVQVLINVNGGDVTGEFANLPGTVTTNPILVSHEMTALLTGPADQVKVALRPGIPQWQRLTTAGNPTWIWDVTALAPGSTHLDLTILARVKAADGVSEQTIHTFHDTIPVRMGWIDATKWWIGQIDPIWKWTSGVVVALGGAFVWWRTNVARKRS